MTRRRLGLAVFFADDTLISEEVTHKRCVLLILCLVFFGVIPTSAQLKGVVIDSSNEEPVPYASIAYRDGKHVTTTDSTGHFQIDRVDKGILSITSVGYEPQSYIVRPNTSDDIIIQVSPQTRYLEEVVVSAKRNKYRRKGNPAVDLMRKVIETKKQNDLHQCPFLQYKSYQKIMAGFNDLQPKDLTRGIFENRPWLSNNLEVCPYNGKLIMPLSIEETVTNHYYRKQPKNERSYVVGHHISGVTSLFQTGEILNVILKEYFTNINLYDDNIRLFQNSFCSPIGRDAILFYHFFISDTLSIGKDLCYQLDFTPANKQDFGFKGKLYVLADSSYQVKRCEFTIPVASDVNWVEGMKCIQEYSETEEGKRVLTVDDMLVELMVTKFTAKAIIIRNTRYSDYAFDAFSYDDIPDSQLNSKDIVEYAHDDDFWSNNRPIALSTAESSLDSLVGNIKKLKGAKYALMAFSTLFENFLGTGRGDKPSKVDIGPIFSTISHNFYDGFRLRIGAQTTAHLFSHFFLKGYYSYATKSHQNYYDGQLIYSFNKPKYLPQEFPRKTIALEAIRDVALPSDKYLEVDKDNMFSSLKINDMDKMFLFNRQSLNLQYERESGVKYYGEFKLEKIKPVGNIAFKTLRASDNDIKPTLRYTETTIGLRYCPGETYLDTKQERWALNYDSPIIRLQHTIGLKGLFGGEYKYNYTEFEFEKSFWLPMNFGCIDTDIKLGAQWNQVPFPLLIMPATNLSYIIEPNTFNLINNMEFLNDRFLSVDVGWDMNGKIFNLIPLLKRLKCREFLGLKCLWGKVTDKNNPFLDCNKDSELLMHFPEGSYVMDSKRPYWEFSVGIHNIFNLLQIEFIRRLSYNELPTSKKSTIKMSLEFKF